MTLEQHAEILAREVHFEAMRNGTPRGGITREVEVVAPDRTVAILILTLKPAPKASRA